MTLFFYMLNVWLKYKFARELKAFNFFKLFRVLKFSKVTSQSQVSEGAKKFAMVSGKSGSNLNTALLQLAPLVDE